MDVEVGRGRFERRYALPSSVREGELRGIPRARPKVDCVPPEQKSKVLAVVFKM